MVRKNDEELLKVGQESVELGASFLLGGTFGAEVVVLLIVGGDCAGVTGRSCWSMLFAGLGAPDP